MISLLHQLKRQKTLWELTSTRRKDGMKIVHIIGDLRTGGAEVMLCKLLSGMDRRRFDPVVVSLRDRGDLGIQLRDLNVPFHVIGMSGMPSLKKVWKMIRLVKQLEPDLIQGWMYHGNLAAQVAAVSARQKIRVLWSIHHSLYGFCYEKPTTAAVIKFCARLSSSPEKIIYVSNTSATQHEAIGYSRENRRVIPIGFDTDTFIPSAAAGISVRSELGLAEDALLIGLVARYHPLKDHANFMKAASLLLQACPQVHFVLAGKGVDTNNKNLLELMNSLGLSSQVHLLGERTDISRITAALDVASSSSSGESFPNVLGEAMACGVPCVVTDVGDSASIVGETGIVVPPRDFTALAEGWSQLIHMDQNQRIALGLEARQRIMDLFSLDAIVKQYEAVYEEAIRVDSASLENQLNNQTATAVSLSATSANRFANSYTIE